MNAAPDLPAPIVPAGRVVALCGGVGGAKLAHGLQAVLGGRLTVIVNTGDDFEHLGLPISPDLDTVTYTLAELADPERGWGRAQETWHFMQALEQAGGESWFRLGDRDLATHVLRARAFAQGTPLSAFTRELCGRLGVAAEIVPMTDDPVSTLVMTEMGELAFQHYFVKLGCGPAVTGLTYGGSEKARPAPGAVARIQEAQTIVICPSNPYLSIDPILSIRDISDSIARSAAPVIAVSPLIGGKAVKGPAAKIMAELGLGASSATIAGHYRGLIDALVIDSSDAVDMDGIDAGTTLFTTDILMRNNDDRRRLATAVLEIAGALQSAVLR
jgi:LPPG:FO 2-phospho-L-lactate transferase